MNPMTISQSASACRRPEVRAERRHLSNTARTSFFLSRSPEAEEAGEGSSAKPESPASPPTAARSPEKAASNSFTVRLLPGAVHVQPEAIKHVMPETNEVAEDFLHRQPCEGGDAFPVLVHFHTNLLTLPRNGQPLTFCSMTDSR